MNLQEAARLAGSDDDDDNVSSPRAQDAVGKSSRPQLDIPLAKALFLIAGNQNVTMDVAADDEDPRAAMLGKVDTILGRLESNQISISQSIDLLQDLLGKGPRMHPFIIKFSGTVNTATDTIPDAANIRKGLVEEWFRLKAEPSSSDEDEMQVDEPRRREATPEESSESGRSRSSKGEEMWVDESGPRRKRTSSSSSDSIHSGDSHSSRTGEDEEMHIDQDLRNSSDDDADGELDTGENFHMAVEPTSSRPTATEDSEKDMHTEMLHRVNDILEGYRLDQFKLPSTLNMLEEVMGKGKDVEGVIHQLVATVHTDDDEDAVKKALAHRQDTIDKWLLVEKARLLRSSAGDDDADGETFEMPADTHPDPTQVGDDDRFLGSSEKVPSPQNDNPEGRSCVSQLEIFL